MVTAAMKLKDAYSLEDQPRQQFKKQRHYFANKGPHCQNCGFSSSHVRMWEGWALKKWYFWTLVFQKTVESPLDHKIKPINCKANQSCILTEKTDAEAETPMFWSPDMKELFIG